MCCLFADMTAIFTLARFHDYSIINAYYLA